MSRGAPAGSLLSAILIGCIKVYRLTLSPWIGQSCRFVPTCSVYAQEAIQHHGALRGGWLALGRLLRCHPWGGHGFDPVPAHGRDVSTDCWPTNPLKARPE